MAAFKVAEGANGRVIFNCDAGRENDVGFYDCVRANVGVMAEIDRVGRMRCDAVFHGLFAGAGLECDLCNGEFGTRIDANSFDANSF